ncbi:MAG TPA: porin family protein [Thermoanaerobaculia bacterium]|nr:porin family protein [Thermoanaerobaculia bacterium]
MSIRSTWILGALLIAFLGSATAPAEAQGSIAIAGGIYQPEEEDDADLDTTEVFGIRGGYRFRPNLGFEASLSRVDLADTLPLDDEVAPPGFGIDLAVDITNLDLSLQWYPGGGNFVVFGGPGFSRLDGEVSITFFGDTLTDSDTADVLTAHAGLGYEWQVTDQFFIRPEARVRRYFDDENDIGDDEEILNVSYEATDYEASVVFGWRFGS